MRTYTARCTLCTGPFELPEGTHQPFCGPCLSAGSHDSAERRERIARGDTNLRAGELTKSESERLTAAEAQRNAARSSWSPTLDAAPVVIDVGRRKWRP